MAIKFSRPETGPSVGEELLGGHLDRLESAISSKDAELRRLRTELELRNLYVAELHAVLQKQARDLEDLSARVRSIDRG